MKTQRTKTRKPHEIYIDVREQAVAYRVFRKTGNITTITGCDNADVKDGCLLLQNAGTVIYVFGPGQWVNVNIDPI